MNVDTLLCRALLLLALLSPAGASLATAPQSDTPRSNAPAAGNAVPDFAALLDEASARFMLPSGFDDVALIDEAAFPFDRALRDESEAMELRYAIRPIARMQINYDDPHSSAPDPDHIFPLVFDAVLGTLARNSASPSREFPPRLARERFNADWASAAAFDVAPAVSKRFRHGFLLALHRSRRADIYTLFLYNDPQAAKARINTLMGHLVFREAAAKPAERDHR